MSWDFQVLSKQSSRALRALRHTRSLLLRTRGQSGSQDRAHREEQASGKSLGSTKPDRLRSGLCCCQAGRQGAGAARVAPAKGVASWQQRPGPRSRRQGQAQAGQLRASPWAPAAQSDPTGTQRLAWCPPWLPGVAPTACQQDCSPQLPASSGPSACTQKAFRGGPRDQEGPGKTRDADYSGDPKVCRGVRSLEQVSRGEGSHKAPGAKCCHAALLPDTQFKRNQKSRFLFCQKLLENSMGQQNPSYIWPPRAL